MTLIEEQIKLIVKAMPNCCDEHMESYLNGSFSSLISRAVEVERERLLVGILNLFPVGNSTEGTMGKLMKHLTPPETKE